MTEIARIDRIKKAITAEPGRYFYKRVNTVGTVNTVEDHGIYACTHR
jgi:hypothetical protein